MAGLTFYHLYRRQIIICHFCLTSATYVTGSGKWDILVQNMKIELLMPLYRPNLKEQNDTKKKARRQTTRELQIDQF